ncbi:hypothetical protein Amet_1112 [Alkaliphilus metalliredigens QYMF]|uniref:Uncharacterized protein n=1 Tax=Alkaliphilus metalliredigens (strain QYMF) TaxID=293826 RepID=A6TMA5_ALKMQ|nr:hypothetical protein [Alkaliphilus metalliredigens]ABR47323.1 hypothetical protein Amet_1112 [Alkaliphilus metalliredigens QYMF]
MGKKAGVGLDATTIALFVFIISIFGAKLTGPNKTALIGAWIAVLGDVLQALGETEEFFEEKSKCKKKEVESIKQHMNLLQRRLDELE